MLHIRWVYDDDYGDGGGGDDNNCGDRGGGNDDGGGNDRSDADHNYFWFRAPRLQQSLRLGVLATGLSYF